MKLEDTCYNTALNYRLKTEISIPFSIGSYTDNISTIIKWMCSIITFPPNNNNKFSVEFFYFYLLRQDYFTYHI